jgi:hypothetical protein
MKFNTLPRIFLEEYDIPNPPVPSLLLLYIAMLQYEKEEEEEEEEEEEDTFIYQCWAHEGHEYSHI